ncbi:hypothetical protein [Novosphingobium sp. CCH12-A3]|uniref:hypothetical protein n=1 Tax=Novosphingobium sp. CCH12-A3 TaxID=1768752 RepID=UPI0018D20B9E|nr:hypothetical protein [Novosphingobium sp. CCH12-A3]
MTVTAMVRPKIPTGRARGKRSYHLGVSFFWASNFSIARPLSLPLQVSPKNPLPPIQPNAREAKISLQASGREPTGANIVPHQNLASRALPFTLIAF